MTIFEKIINQKEFANIIFENKDIIAILDINPITTGHTLIIPKIKSRNLIDIKEKSFNKLMFNARKVALKLIKKLDVDGFRLCINNETSSMQEILYTHVHIIPTESNKKINPKIFKLI